MEIALETFRNCDIGLNASSVPKLFENTPKETLRFKKIFIFCCGKQSSFCRKEIILPFLQLD